MSSFYMTLPSDSALFPNNTTAQFRNRLAKPIELQKEDWEVALAEIIIPSGVFNITEEESRFYVVSNSPDIVKKFQNLKPVFPPPPHCRGDTDKKLALCISAGVYNSPSHLLKTISETITAALGQSLPEVVEKLKIEYSKEAKRVKFTTPSDDSTIGLEFCESLLNKMGVNVKNLHNGALRPADKVFERDVDINAGFNFMYIYSDVVAYTACGDVEAPLLRVIPVHTSEHRHIHHEFTNLHYVPVAKSYFDEVSINIYGDIGKIIQFTEGKSLVKLHFRKKSKLNW